jgi:predicted heme/steroid binding protein
MRSLILVVAAACATSGAGSSYGVLNMKDVWGPGAPPGIVQVGPGHVVGSDFELRENGDCVTGYYHNKPVSFCRDKNEQNRWSGPSGDFLLERDGNLYNVTGNMLWGGGTIPLNESIPLNASSGKAWQELVNHPALLAVLTELPALH